MATPSRKALNSERNSDARLIGLFLDMLAAEQGSGANTIDAYRRDLEDLSHFVDGRKRQFTDVSTDGLRAYLDDLDQRGFKAASAARRLSAMRHLFRFLLGEGLRKDDPAAILHRTEAHATATKGPVDRRRRPPAGAGENGYRTMRRQAAGKTAHDAPRLPARGAVCDRLARLRARGVAAVGGTTRRTHDRGARQGQQGAAGTVERCRAPGDGGSSSGDDRRRGPRAALHKQNGCFRHRAKAAI